MISVIGAGPAGLYTSYLLSKKGFDVRVFEQKENIGLPVQCTGIITSEIKKIINLPDNIILNRINSIEVNSASNSSLVRLKQPDIVIDRAKFDCFLAEKSKEQGTKITMQKSLLAKSGKDIILKDIKTKKTEKIQTDVLIGADGPLSKVYKILNPNRPRVYYKGIQARIRGSFDRSVYRVFLGSLCPDFFAWIVPENEEVARIGLASLSNPKEKLDKFLEKTKINKKNILEMQAGLIPLYDPKIKTQTNNTFLIGDAAGQVKATTGGGIVQSLIAARSLCKAISKNINYEKEWRKNLSKDLWIHLMIRNYLNRFNDNDYYKLISSLKNSKLKRILETESRDHPSRFVVKAIMAEPSLLGFFSKLF